MDEKEILKQLRIDLKEAFDTPKCKKCGCLRDTLIAVREETATIEGEEADALRADIDQFLTGMQPIQYQCLGCDPCYPAVAENRFHAAAEPILPLTIVQRPSCAFEVRTDGDWPVVAGEYFVLDPGGSVAVSTLASPDLAAQLAQRRPRGLSIVGKTETENIGIDKVVKNIVANPCIRTLIVAGQDPKGHLSGQALLALAQNGVDERQRIVGAKGKRPFLRNVTQQEIEQFRQQVTVVDMIGCDDPEVVATKVESIGSVCQCACQLPLGERSGVATVKRVKAHLPEGPLKLDKAGYFVIILQPEKRMIVVEHYDYRDRLQHIVEGEDARSLCATILELGLITQLDHAAYLGRELMRAEMALRHSLPFVQDGA
ncbi:MAG: DUF4346 domain-containing protein [Armatimonadetes bacterium]|nr:DUF4346 domain-containing protein [Armatimonadota bacterium]MDW8122003.1 DUF4346 domain-containing protein [Armatimonadota bacterium]